MKKSLKKTCINCIHYNVCKMYGAFHTKRRIYSKWKNCPFRNDKAKYIELPCKVGDNFFIIARRFEKGKYTEYFIDERQVSCFEYDGKNLTVYDFDGIDFDIDNIYFDKSKAESKLMELNNETT